MCISNSLFASMGRILKPLLALVVLLALHAPAESAFAQRLVTGGTVDNASLAQGDDLIQAILDVQNPVSPFFGQDIHLVPPGGNPGTWYYTIRPGPAMDDRFDAGTGLPKIFRPVRIIGDPDTTQCQRRTVIIQAQMGQVLRLFFVRPDPSNPVDTSLELQNVVLERGNLPDSGGAIFLDESMLTMTDCVARNNRSTNGRGGAIFATRKSAQVMLQLTRTSFQTNAAAVTGGAVHAQMESIVRGCSFTGNTAGNSPGFATGDGGAFYSSAFNLRMEPSPTCTGVGSPILTTFENNQAAFGGAIYNNAQPQSTSGGDQFRLFDQVQFRNNRATFTGGAVHNFGTTGALAGQLFMRCRFGEINASNQALAGTGNTAGSLGGAIFNNSTSSPFIVNSLFAGNAVAEVALPGSGEPIGRGGAIASLLTCRPIIRQCEFIENTALRDGGAVSSQSDGCRTTIDDSVFLRNRAGAPGSPGGDNGRGGGVYTGGSAVSFLHNCAFARNIAAQGGAIGNENSGSCLVLHCTLSSSQRGGGVYNLGTSTTDSIGRRFVNSIIWGNRLTGAGDPLTDVASFTGSGGSLTVDYSDLDTLGLGHPAIVGTGNINCDPLHVDPTMGNLHLTQCSPCIDRANETLRQSVFSTTSAFSTATLSGSGLPATLSGLIPPFVQTNDYDDNGTEPGNFGYADLIDPRPVTPRVQQCEVDMGADESLFFIWADLALTCKQRTGGTCGAPTFGPDPAGCAFCIGDNAVFEPTITSSCPLEFRVVQWRRLSAGSPCPPVSLNDPLPGTAVVEGGRFSIDATTGRLCITGVQAADAGCYYAVLERQSCGNLTNRGPFKQGDNQTLPCVQRIAACACITVNSPPLITVQPQGRNLCDGAATSISVTATAPPGRDLCYQWFRRATPCDDSCPTPGAGGTLVSTLGLVGVSGFCSSTLTFAPLSPAHEGYYYVRVFVKDLASPMAPSCGCTIDSSADIDCRETTSCCARIDVVCKPTADVTPATANVCANGDQTFTATFAQCAGQDLPIVVQWFRRTFQDPFCGGAPTGDVAVGSPFTLPADNNSSTSLTIDASPASAGCYFVRVYIEGFSECSADSPCRCLNVIPPPTITADPNDRIVCENGVQQLSAIVGYTGNPADLCFKWYKRATPCPANPTAADGTEVVNGGGISGATTTTLTFDPAVPSHDGYYFLCVRVCSFQGNQITELKCPPVYSTCGRLEVREPPVACEIVCPGTPDPNTGNCLICIGANASLQCGDSQDPELCYQWQRQAFPLGPWEDIPNQNGFRYIITAYNDAVNRGCYRVRINYLAFAQGNDCPAETDKCDAVYSNIICLAPDPNCCIDDCACKDNTTPTADDRYALWRTGEWDGVNGEPSYEGSLEGSFERRLIKSADDVYLCPFSMHRISVFNGYMMVKAANPALPLQARLQIYSDCNGVPGELIEELEPDCIQNQGMVPSQPEFRRIQFQFTPECLWLRGGIYWFSLVAIGPEGDTTFEAYWATAGMPGNPSFPPPPGVPDGYLLGKRPVFMDGLDPWQEFDPCCHPCDDLEFCITGESCPIIWDNGGPELNGADGPTPPAMTIVQGTRSEKSALPVRDSRAADQFVIKTCNTEEVCYLEGYIYTNCVGFIAHLEIYENDCKVPDFTIPGGVPYYQRVATTIEDLGIDGLKVGTISVRAYKISFCDWPIPLVFQPGRNYWVSLSVQDSFSSAERAFFAHAEFPCERCETPEYWKIAPGMEIAPGRQIPEWQSVDADFAFLIATRKQAEAPTQPGVEPDPCPVDLNNNNTTDVEDIFLFLSAFFNGCP